MQTKRLNLVLRTPQEVHAMIAGMSEGDKAQISADWLKQVNATSIADPWIHGYSVLDGSTGLALGQCCFKGPPASDGVVEIAYGIDPAYQRQGFATEAAQCLIDYAFGDARVHVVCAHTLPESNASTRLLTKCGFQYIGEVIDPEDGLIWRWEQSREQYQCRGKKTCRLVGRQ